MEQIVAGASATIDPSTGRVVRLTQDHVYYIADKEHASMVWFGVGVAAFAACYIIGAFAAGGLGAPWRFLPVDGEDASDESLWSAKVLSAIGAAVCAACIIVSYAVHWWG